MNPFRTGQLVMFQVSYDRTWHFFELIFFIIIGVFGGLYGAFVIKWNLRAQAFRKKYLSSYPVTEATILAGLTALLCYPNMFLRINMTQMMEVLFQECGDDERTNYGGICELVSMLPLIMLSMLISFFLQSQKSMVNGVFSFHRHSPPNRPSHHLLRLQGSCRHFCAFHGHRSHVWAVRRNPCSSFTRIVPGF